ncbi:P2Y purinoceptor 13-like [Eucyclogobius newberryi]|uniref:P2Y purinoceptor 13-like n=1 Tax=Eucyclogobius newberryi TaxID=166745 RepID=UPI003B5A6147
MEDEAKPSVFPSVTNTSDDCNDVYSNPFSTLYFIMFPVALLLNSVAAWVAVHLKSTTTFIVYLKNLIGADLILTLMLPAVAISELPAAPRHLYVLSCKFFRVIFYSAFYTSITFLGLISLDRFAKIVTPRSKFGGSVMLSSVIALAVWGVIFGLNALPTIFLSNKQTNETEIQSCMETKVPAGIVYHKFITITLNVYFWFISVVVVICYICISNKVIQSFRKSGSNNSKGKQKIKLRVFMVLVVFFGSFGPYHVIRIPYTFDQVNAENNCFWWSKLAKDFGLWLATNNICLDPLLYVFLCREFKEKLSSLFKKFTRIRPGTTSE